MPFSRKLPLIPMLLALTAAAAGETVTLPADAADYEAERHIPQQEPQYRLGGETFARPGNAETNAAPATDAAAPYPSPQMTEQLLNRALLLRRYDDIPPLLAAYRNWPQADPVLTAFAQGALYRHQGRHGKAAALYRDILKQHPQLQTVRLDLAAMLHEDKQLRDSAAEFARTVEQGLPDDVMPRIRAYLHENKQQQAWQFSATLAYTADKNVNNVSAEEIIYVPQLPGLPLRKNPEYLPQQAHGFEYGLAAARDLNLGGHHYLHLGADWRGVSYWDNHRFDDAALRLNTGYRRRSLRGEYSLIPFVEKRRYGGEAYYKRYGAELAASRWFGRRWQLSAHLSRARKNYDAGFKGRETGGGGGFSYLAGSSGYFFGGLYASREQYGYGYRSGSRRFGGYAGWGKQWNFGLGSRISVSRYSERYDDRHYIYTDRRRTDHTTGLNLTLWHKRLQWRGITPKLNWRHTRTDSNIGALYGYRKNRLFVSLEKAF